MRIFHSDALQYHIPGVLFRDYHIRVLKRSLTWKRDTDLKHATRAYIRRTEEKRLQSQDMCLANLVEWEKNTNNSNEALHNHYNFANLLVEDLKWGKEREKDGECGICREKMIDKAVEWRSIFAEADKIKECIKPDEEWSERLNDAILARFNEILNGKGGIDRDDIFHDAFNAILDLEKAYYRLKQAREKIVPAYTCVGVVQLRCGHIFGESCIMNWLGGNVTCPTCRLDPGVNSEDFPVEETAKEAWEEVLEELEEMLAPESREPMWIGDNVWIQCSIAREWNEHGGIDVRLSEEW